MGGGTSFSLEETPDFDRKIQNEMVEQPMLKTWGIFHTRRDEGLAKTFVNTLQCSMRTYNYPTSAPRLFPVDGIRFDRWEQVLKQSLNPNVTAIVLILPGSRGRAELYDDCKRLLISQLPVPSQVSFFFLEKDTQLSLTLSPFDQFLGCLGWYH
mmetsp:Transcript_8989/g.9726  ORF Transcript_8989/g.9726 Transcript_8989/m.9726 type:complete len:154 (-) Transcript_8989:141-602(-)